ncbi:MAG: hypothetical protein IKI64_01335 [Clostridia bacterium]|nr:hypothetical protein [Clostridia bacterium]
MEVLYINKNQRKRRRFKKSVLVVAAGFLLLMLLLLLVLMHFGGSEGTARIGSIETSQTVTAVVVRRESVVTGGEFDLADRYMQEGQRVAAGDRVMDVYKLGYSREITMSLWRTRQEIYEAQLGVLGEARDVELRNYDNEIEKLKKELSDSVLSGDTSGVLELKDRLTMFLTDRSEYLRSTIQETETLRSLYRLADERETAVSDSRIALIADRGGRVSYYFDDYSAALNADKLSIVTSELIDSIIKKNEKSPKWTAAGGGAYRIVDGSEWYLVFNTPLSQGMRVSSGEKHSVDIRGYGKFEGIGETSFVSGQKVVNIIKISADIGTLIDVRTVRAEIGFAAEGIRVEKRAVQFEDGKPFVELMIDGKRTGVYVNVFAEDGGHAIIGANNTSSAPLNEGVRYWIPKKKLFK